MATVNDAAADVMRAQPVVMPMEQLNHLGQPVANKQRRHVIQVRPSKGPTTSGMRRVVPSAIAVESQATCTVNVLHTKRCCPPRPGGGRRQ